MIVLVLESSTTSAKAMLYCSERGVLEVRTKAFTLRYGDSSVQDGEDCFMQLALLGKEICEGRQIDMVALGGTWHSLMLCGRDMHPETPLYQWSFTGARDLCRKLRQDEAFVLEYYKRTGCMVNAIYPSFKLKFLKETGTNLKDKLVMGQGTYNTYRLTGKRVIMDSMASGTGLMDIRKKSFDNEILKDIGIEADQLSRIVTYREPLTLTEEGARLLGLKSGIPVIAAGPDGALNQVGAGALKQGIMTFSAGTSGALRFSVTKPVIPDKPSTWCYLSPAAWLSGAATSGCCNCVDWVKSKFFDEKTTYTEIESDLGEPKGMPIFLPFLYGERCPGWQDDRGAAFLDVKPYHTGRDFYYSVLEGTLFNLYQCYSLLCRINALPERIILSGGILHSPFWTQMCADIFGTEMETADMEHSSLIGAAVLALEVSGCIRDISDYSTEISRRVIPNRDMRKVYSERFGRYMHLYDRSKEG